MSTANRFEQLSQNNVYSTPPNMHPPPYPTDQYGSAGMSGMAVPGPHGVQDFSNMTNDEKLSHILTKVSNIDVVQTEMCRTFQQFETSMKVVCGRVDTVVSCVDMHSKMLKLLAYKSIDSEARCRRINLLFRGMAERDNEECWDTITKFLTSKLFIDRDQFSIARAHRLGRPRYQYIRPIIVAFGDYTDTELVMSKVRHLKGTGFGVDRDYPREIVDARKKLYPGFKLARETQKRPAIKYPARLVVDGKTIQDEFPDWYDTMQLDRVAMVNGFRTINHDRDAYSTSTVPDGSINSMRQHTPPSFSRQTSNPPRASPPQDRHSPSQTLIGQRFNLPRAPPPHGYTGPRQVTPPMLRGPPPAYPRAPPPHIVPSPPPSQPPHGYAGPRQGTPQMLPGPPPVYPRAPSPSIVPSPPPPPQTHMYSEVVNGNTTYNVSPQIAGSSTGTMNTNTNVSTPLPDSRPPPLSKRKASESPIVDNSAVTVSPGSDQSQSILRPTPNTAPSQSVNTTNSENVNNSVKSGAHRSRSNKRHQSRAPHSSNSDSQSVGANTPRAPTNNESRTRSTRVNRPHGTNNNTDTGVSQ
ncbi:MAG: hypothetical protein ABW185_04505 [Sedimenticola sp.]